MAKTKTPAAAPVKKKTKKQLHKEAWLAGNVHVSVAQVMQTALADARLVFKDDSISTAGEAGGMVIGVPLPAFSAEYVLQNTVFPLERVSQTVGIQGVCKSGLGFEIARWFRKFSHGVATLFEHENKLSSDWPMSIIGWDDPDALGIIPCGSVDDWQKKLLWMEEKVKRMMTGTKTEPGSGRVWPWLGIVDSVMGFASAETQAKIQSKGFAGRARPEEARMITAFLRHLPETLRGWPISVITVNHLKPNKDEHTGATIRSKTGGRGLDFMETFEIEMAAMEHKKIRTSTYEGMRLKMSCKKNSLGTTDRWTPINVTWWEEEVFDAKLNDTAWRQITLWDWFDASMRLLLLMPKTEEPKAKRLAEIIRVQPVTGGKVVCKELGITKASPLSYREAGMVLQETPEVLDALRRLFGVKVRATFDNSVDYRKQRVMEKMRIKGRISPISRADRRAVQLKHDKAQPLRPQPPHPPKPTHPSKYAALRKKKPDLEIELEGSDDEIVLEE